MKITAHWHRSDCLRSPESGHQVESVNGSGANPKTIKLGFFKLKIHQRSAKQATLLAQLNSTTNALTAPLVTTGGELVSDSLPHTHARRASTSTIGKRTHDPLPSFKSLVGDEFADRMDETYGELVYPREKLGVSGIKSFERDENGKPLVHANRTFIPDENDNFSLGSIDVEAIRAGTKRYMFTIGRMGRMIVAEESVVIQA